MSNLRIRSIDENDRSRLHAEHSFLSSIGIQMKYEKKMKRIYDQTRTFFQMGISDTDTDHGANGWKMRTLESMHKMLESKMGEDGIIDYLKIDVESSEWKALPQIMKSGMFDKVKQIGVEFHFYNSTSLTHFRDGVRIIKSLEDYGMVRFTSRVNIFMAGKVNILGRNDYVGYEIAWYNQNFRV